MHTVTKKVLGANDKKEIFKEEIKMTSIKHENMKFATIQHGVDKKIQLNTRLWDNGMRTMFPQKCKVRIEYIHGLWYSSGAYYNQQLIKIFKQLCKKGTFDETNYTRGTYPNFMGWGLPSGLEIAQKLDSKAQLDANVKVVKMPLFVGALSSTVTHHWKSLNTNDFHLSTFNTHKTWDAVRMWANVYTHFKHFQRTKQKQKVPLSNIQYVNSLMICIQFRFKFALNLLHSIKLILPIYQISRDLHNIKQIPRIKKKIEAELNDGTEVDIIFDPNHPIFMKWLENQKKLPDGQLSQSKKDIEQLEEKDKKSLLQFLKDKDKNLRIETFKVFRKGTQEEITGVFNRFELMNNNGLELNYNPLYIPSISSLMPTNVSQVMNDVLDVETIVMGLSNTVLQKRQIKFAPLCVTSEPIKDFASLEPNDPRILWELNPTDGYNSMCLIYHQFVCKFAINLCLICYYLVVNKSVEEKVEVDMNHAQSHLRWTQLLEETMKMYYDDDLKTRYIENSKLRDMRTSM